jgi:hypothetical protein
MYLNRPGVREVLHVARNHLSGRRVSVWLAYAAGFFTVRGVLRIARWIDDRLWPEIVEQRIERPVFIFGNARSGTTLLHRLMSLDEEHFASMKLYQSIFCRVIIYRGIAALDRFDRRVPGRPLRRLVDLINREVFSSWKGIHEMGLDEPEEDEAIFALSLMTPAVSLLLPYIDELPGLTAFDSLPIEERRGFMDLYEDALRRHLFASGGQRTFLNKNALFAPRVQSMFERFPDARFVYLVRHPFQAIPSFLDMFHTKWITHSPGINPDSPEAHALSRLAIAYYRYALDCRKVILPARFITIRYDDLVADPKQTIEILYESLGVDMSPSFAADLDRSLQSQLSFTSRNSYSMKRFGLCEKTVYDELRDIFEEFDFEPPSELPVDTDPSPLPHG